MDIALTLDYLVPAAKYFGSVTDNTEDSFNMLRWFDERPKPSWEGMLTAWPTVDSANTVKEAEEEKIQAEIRLLAIQSLQGKEELPPGFEGKRP